MSNLITKQYEYRMFLAKRLRLARLDKGYSQEYVALELGLSQPTMSSYENGNTTPDYCLIVEFSKFYDVSTLYFFPE